MLVNVLPNFGFDVTTPLLQCAFCLQAPLQKARLLAARELANLEVLLLARLAVTPSLQLQVILLLGYLVALPLADILLAMMRGRGSTAVERFARSGVDAIKIFSHFCF